MQSNGGTSINGFNTRRVARPNVPNVRRISPLDVDFTYYPVDPESVLDSVPVARGFTSARFEASSLVHTSNYGYYHILYGILLVCLVFAGFFFAPLGKMLGPGHLVAIIRLVGPSLVSYVLLTQTQRLTCEEIVVAPYTRYVNIKQNYVNDERIENGKTVVVDNRDPLAHHEVAAEGKTSDYFIYQKYKFVARPFVYGYNIIDNLIHVGKIIRELFLPPINIELDEEYKGDVIVSTIGFDMLQHKYTFKYRPENESVHESYLKSLKRLNLDYDSPIYADTVEFYENFCRYESQHQCQIPYYYNGRVWPGEGFQSSQGLVTKGAT